MEIVRDGYNSIAARYLEVRRGLEDSEDVRLLEELKKRLPKGARVLDAGCGGGLPVAGLLSEYFQVIGIDFAEAQVRLAHQMVPQAQFMCQDMTQLAFVDSSFDAVCSYYAIIHIPRQKHEAVLYGFHRVLRPSGWALLCLGAGDLPDTIENDYLGAAMYWSHYSAAVNLEMLSRAGFDIVWSRIVKDATSEQAAHLFVLAQRCEAP